MDREPPFAPTGWRLPSWSVPLGLFVLAIAVRALAAAQVTFAPTEVSAYYVGVAGNLAAGRGLVSDAIWSYASPPLSLPQPAFSLWMPLASLLAAGPMLVLGSSLAAAQVSTVLLGAAIAPLTWFVAREAAGQERLVGRRALVLALGCGLLAAVFGPFLVAVAGPDSSVPFLVFGVAACCVMPRVLGAMPPWRWGIALGVLLGLAYLSRQEAVWIGLAYLLLLVAAWRGVGSVEPRVPDAARSRWLTRALLAPLIGGALTVAPWLLRNVVTFGSALPGQALENAWFTRTADVFAYAPRPSAATFLAQGPGTILGNVVAGLGHQLLEVLLVTTIPVGIVGLLGLVWLRRSPAVRRVGALPALILSGALIFMATGLLFPVATLAGTFLHAAGPALVALIVLAGLAGDRAVARVGAWRGWDKENAWLAPLLLLAVATPVAALEVSLTASIAARAGARVAAAADALERVLPAGSSGTPAAVISDHPIWLAETAGRPVIVLPDEPPADVLGLARDFGAAAVLVFGDRPRDAPSPDGQPCFLRQPLPAAAGGEARLFLVAQGCGT